MAIYVKKYECIGFYTAFIHPGGRGLFVPYMGQVFGAPFLGLVRGTE